MSNDTKRMSKKKLLKCQQEAALHLNKKPSKEQLSIVKYLRSKLPSLEGKLSGQVVQIFIASVAIDVLMQSHWASKPEPRTSGPVSNSKSLANQNGMNGVSYYLSSRIAATQCMSDLLRLGLFHRADKMRRIRKCAQPAGPASIASGEERSASGTTLASNNQSRPSSKQNNKESLVSGSKKARIKLECSTHQFFDDSPDSIFVWIYEPILWWNYVLGGLLLVVIILVCLFPLWPPPLRSGSYYVAMGAVGLLCGLIVLGMLRALLFACCWAVTMSKCHFWLFPNLFADCGVLESFQPLYSLDSVKKKTTGKSRSCSSANKVEEVGGESTTAAVESQSTDELSKKTN